MGYFSNYAIEHIPQRCERWVDRSYLTPKQQLLCRLDELETRLQELAEVYKYHDRRTCFREDDLRYLLPEQFRSAADVRAAIEVTIDDLAEQYGVYIRSEFEPQKPVMDEVTKMQITFLDFMHMQALTSAA